MGLAITLLTFPVAKGLMNAANLNQPDRLPIPYQLALMTRMNSERSQFLYHWLWYVLFFRKGRSKQPPGLTWMTFIIIISWILRSVIRTISIRRQRLANNENSILFFAADTWLHIATKSVNLVQVSASPNT